MKRDLSSGIVGDVHDVLILLYRGGIHPHWPDIIYEKIGHFLLFEPVGKHRDELAASYGATAVSRSDNVSTRRSEPQ